jgi:hypothetical protein
MRRHLSPAEAITSVRSSSVTVRQKMAASARFAAFAEGSSVTDLFCHPRIERIWAPISMQSHRSHTPSQSVRTSPTPAAPPLSQSIDWYAEGQARIVEIGGIKVLVKFVGRKGRRGRIAIIAPPGATFLQI